MLYAQREEVRGNLSEPFREMANDNELGFLYGETGQFTEASDAYGVARAYAGHTDTTGPATTTYIKASQQEVATALAVMTGQPHPLALPPVRRPQRLLTQ